MKNGDMDVTETADCTDKTIFSFVIGHNNFKLLLIHAPKIISNDTKHLLTSIQNLEILIRGFCVIRAVRVAPSPISPSAGGSIQIISIHYIERVLKTFLLIRSFRVICG